MTEKQTEEKRKFSPLELIVVVILVVAVAIPVVMFKMFCKVLEIVLSSKKSKTPEPVSSETPE